MLEWLISNKLIQNLFVHFVGLFFVFIIENARSKKQKNKKIYNYSVHKNVSVKDITTDFLIDERGET